MKALVLLLALLATHLSGAEPAIHEFQAPHMGCLFTFKIVSADADYAQQAAIAAFARVAELDAKFSDYSPTSELALLSATAGSGKSVLLSRELAAVLGESGRFWKWSEGTFDITLGACTKLWRTSRKSHALPESAMLQQARATVGFEKLTFTADQQNVTLTQAGTQLDLGGIAKGWALDEVSNLLVAKFHCSHFLLDAGGQIAAIGHPPGREAWGLAIEKLPTEPADAPTLVLKLKDRHLATSGDLHQSVTINGKTYAHIIDPTTGLGLTYTVQASVIAMDGTTADAVATALCLLPQAAAETKLKSLPGVAARVLRQNPNQALSIWQTPGWAAYQAPAPKP